jgi:hypothetical protein
LILEAAVTDQRGMARSAAGPHGQIQRLVDGWQGKRRVGSDDDGLLLVSEPVNDRKEHLLPPLESPKMTARHVVVDLLEFITGKTQIFAGPLRDNRGVEQVKAGAFFPLTDLGKMDWLVEGVIGQPR